MPEFTQEKITALRKIAEQATQGGRIIAGSRVTTADGSAFAQVWGINWKHNQLFIAEVTPETVLALLDALEAKTAEVEAAERQLAIRAEDSIARRLAMATVAEVGTETAAGDTADTLAELLIEAERERDEARAEASKIEGRAVEWSKRAEKAEAALERVKALHECLYSDSTGGPVCAACVDSMYDPDPWPCRTIQAIEGADDE